MQEEVSNSAVAGPTEYYVTLCCLLLCFWVTVLPYTFQFAIIPLIADCGTARMERISWTHWSQWWHPIPVPRSNSVSSLEWSILPQGRLHGYWLDFCTLAADWLLTENTWIQRLGILAQYSFIHIVYLKLGLTQSSHWNNAETSVKCLKIVMCQTPTPLCSAN